MRPTSVIDLMAILPFFAELVLSGQAFWVLVARRARRDAKL